MPEPFDLDQLPTFRVQRQPQALFHSYEKAGLIIANQPVPWNAEAVLVEATVRLTTPAMRNRADFSLRLGDRPPLVAEEVRRLEPVEDGDPHRHVVRFRLPPPGSVARVEVLWRDHPLGQLELPYQNQESFLDGLRLVMPTVSVRIGDRLVACRTYVSSQCKGLVAAGVLTSPVNLAPLLDLDVHLELIPQSGGTGRTFLARLSTSQVTGKQALITVAPARPPGGTGEWLVSWSVGGRPLASQRIKAITQRQFVRSLRLMDARFVLQSSDGRFSTTRTLPSAEQGHRVGPCFLICSREAGMAALCQPRVQALITGTGTPPVLLDQEVFISDGPTVIAPGTLDANDLAQVQLFQLSIKDRVLGELGVKPAPTAAFTSEGGFKPPPDYAWTAAAEAEMNERLARLLQDHFH